MKVTQVFDKILRKKEGVSKQEDHKKIYSETLVRSAMDEYDYSEWVYAKKHDEFLVWLRDEYILSSNTDFSNKNLKQFKEENEEGFYFRFNDVFDEEDFQNFFDYLKDKAIELSFRLFSSERRIEETSDGVKVIEVYSLEPKIEGKALDVLSYGYLTLSQTIQNGYPTSIKVSFRKMKNNKYVSEKLFQNFVQQLFY